MTGTGGLQDGIAQFPYLGDSIDLGLYFCENKSNLFHFYWQVNKEKTMKLPGKILSRRKFVGSTLLGGLVAPFLKTERVEALPTAGFGPQVKITALGVPYGRLQTVTYGYTLIGEIGHFQVQDPASTIKVTYTGRIQVQNFGSGSTWVFFELRVDGKTPLPHTGETQLQRLESGLLVQVTFSGIFQNLSTGDHVVSMWSYSDSLGATGSTINPGAYGTAMVLIEEYLPLGTTYLPLVQN